MMMHAASSAAASRRSAQRRAPDLRAAATFREAVALSARGSFCFIGWLLPDPLELPSRLPPFSQTVPQARSLFPLFPLPCLFPCFFENSFKGFGCGGFGWAAARLF